MTVRSGGGTRVPVDKFGCLQPLEKMLKLHVLPYAMRHKDIDCRPGRILTGGCGTA